MDAKWSLLVTIQLSLFLFGLASSPPAFCHENERSALLEFKKIFFNKTPDSCFLGPKPYRKIESWKLEVESKNCCAWDGVECDPDSGHVIGIELGDSCLSGSVNSNTSLFHLVHLQRLDLSDNYLLGGQVPPEILNMTNLLSFDLSTNNAMILKKPNLLDLLQKLTKLENLSLSWVRISAPIPDIVVNSSSLRSLRLDSCNLTGEFPPTFFKMPKLEFLDISENYDLSGHLPEFFWRSSLKSLWIRSCNFSGHLPSSLGNLTSLNELHLDSNNFIGQIPPSLGNLTSLNELFLSSNNFIGQIPPSIGYLTQLTMLSFENNHLTDEIPISIGNLTQLVEFSLSYNQLTGAIPSSIGRLSNLNTLLLRSNRLTGEIPSSFINLTELTDMNLMSNKISGQFPPQLTKLTHLSSIDLRSNNLKGTVRISLFSKLQKLHMLLLSFNKLSFVDDLININTNLTNLLYIGLASCNLSSFPTFLQRQERLDWVDLSCNNINGEIPEWFLSMHTESLRNLNLSNNLLTSSLQRPLNLRWKSLFSLDLRENNLKGPLPVPSASAHISYYFPSRNKFSGYLPSKTCELGFLDVLDLSENYLTGVLPKCLHNLSQSLSVLSLRDDRFIGEISSIFNNAFCRLRMVDFSNNRFNGSLPRSLTRCTDLELLNIGNNKIRDTFPSWLGTLPDLQVLILHSNEFHGTIGDPEGKDEFFSLRIIDLSSNNFESCLPSAYFKSWRSMKCSCSNLENYMGGLDFHVMLDSEVYFGIVYDYTMTLVIKGVKMSFPKVQNYLTFIDLSSNNFSCEIPGTIESLVEVQYLNLSNNNLIGPIPSFLKALTQLEALDLSQNKLSGKIPQELTRLTFLEKFNVSYNNLCGSIPEGRQFATFDNDSYIGNAELCGLPLSKKCKTIEVLPQPQPTGEGEESIEIDWKVVLMGCGYGLVIGVIIGQGFTVKPPDWMLNFFRRRAQMKRR